ncbi:MAG: tRNA pseudouridine(38-40) synthase TruA [Bacteroidales bacterium]|jgi:tRNA pseudouridine38-40 synthase|nr:tRNA pseudouridine(38-40) synthase TruA [Bacteroidales bacterium]
MKTYKITVAYDGTKYNGWQIQRSSDATIQGKISSVLTKMAGSTVEVHGSGRTDAGVHALGQVASFSLEGNYPRAQILAYLNLYLPDDIAVKDIAEVDNRFHARLSCRRKTYRYRIHTSIIPDVFRRKYVYTYHDNPLNVSMMRKAAALLVGTHDFKAFCGNPHFKKSSVRTIYGIDITDDSYGITIDFTGDGFLQNMVRILAGTLIEVGNGNIAASSMPEILESKDRQRAGFTAPAMGLTLVSVEY